MKWQREMAKLRTILLECGLDEERKWGKPCFLLEGRNIAILQPFKAHCSLTFFKGALLRDTRQPQTRIARIQRCIPKILAGLGMNDR